MMKKINYLFGFLAIAGLTVFTSCEETEVGPAPSITFDNITGTEVELAAGATSYTINGTATSEEGLDFIKFYQVTDAGKTQLGTAIEKKDMDDNTNFRFSFTVEDISETVTIEVEATDVENQTATKNLKLIYTPAGNPINSTSSVVLGASGSSTGSFCVSADGTVYTSSQSNDHQADIDFVYFYGATNLATLAAPDASDFSENFYGNILSWTTRNSTRFSESPITGVDWAAIETDVDIQAVHANDDKKKAKELSTGEVYAFTTDDGRKGLVKVDALSEGSSGTITISIKVEKAE